MMRVVEASEEHFESMADLLKEMDHFYGDTTNESLEARVAQIKTALASDPPAALVLLAFFGESLVGLLSYSFVWPAAGLTRSIFVKELYVRESHRQVGAGKELLRSVAEVALDTGCSRVEWQTEASNSQAVGFYAKLGAPQLDGKLLYRVEDSNIQRLAGSGSDGDSE